MTRGALSTVLLLPLALLPACGDEAAEGPRLPPEYRVAERYAAALRVDLDVMERRPNGLHVRDMVLGEGMRADSGDIARVHYTGWLASGVEFDSSRGEEPFEVALGYGRVIKGWDQGVVGMRVGGQRRLVVPPALGYGSGGRGRIPGGATLVFDVELVEVVDRTPPAAGGEPGGDPSP